MAETKTKPTDVSVEAFLDKVPEKKKREDAFVVLEMMKRVTGLEPVMWGPTMIGFGSYHYKYDSGHEGDAFLTGFSPRKQSMTIYLIPGFSEQFQPLLQKLGKHKTSVACLYINKLADVDMKVLEKLVSESFAKVKKIYK